MSRRTIASADGLDEANQFFRQDDDPGRLRDAEIRGAEGSFANRFRFRLADPLVGPAGGLHRDFRIERDLAQARDLAR